MAETKQTIEQFERERNLVFHGDVDLKQRMTAEEFDVFMAENTWTGVDFKFREQWLKDNGYEITRENLINVELPSKEAQAGEENTTDAE